MLKTRNANHKEVERLLPPHLKIIDRHSAGTPDNEYWYILEDSRHKNSLITGVSSMNQRADDSWIPKDKKKKFKLIPDEYMKLETRGSITPSKLGDEALMESDDFEIEAIKRSQPLKTLFNDPFYKFQWPWYNDGTVPGTTAGFDMNIAKVLKSGYNGSGIVILLIDDGIDMESEQLEAVLTPKFIKNFLPDDEELLGR
ncbi:hypothetical protein Ciccas_007035 [Cichlidogyrus casuarinus]|uniref:Uncharacterized protein n=1 Tax=Cichlidogyrus casuarinus TaxID=1844966 RepID=A0ABD2Q427_9PLAT